MPNIRVFIDNIVFYKRLDDYFSNYLLPFLTSILDKHHLSSTKSYMMPLKGIAPESSNIAKDFLIVIKGSSSNGYKEVLMNQETTCIFNRIIEKNISEELAKL